MSNETQNLVMTDINTLPLNHVFSNIKKEEDAYNKVPKQLLDLVKNDGDYSVFIELSEDYQQDMVRVNSHAMRDSAVIDLMNGQENFGLVFYNFDYKKLADQFGATFGGVVDTRDIRDLLKKDEANEVYSVICFNFYKRQEATFCMNQIYGPVQDIMMLDIKSNPNYRNYISGAKTLLERFAARTYKAPQD